ncbi:hypothetical protein B0H15DRAFT_951467 [Mycena belliarum]|uniref:BTB domain-containing protein n=1 Tax=Mycena belliarum TaxID=1033014 RepID=A0AAD6U2E6_9AGAR|nr:hypothetical protein B0H15DRAFT_951467 [Mycena belliae]
MTTPSTSSSSSRKSELFDPADADVVFQSCDGVLFGVHRANLQTHTDGFPPAEFATAGEVCALSESAETLEALFQFVYRRRHPTLAGLPFARLAPLAEAAEKYQVFAAMNICHIRMQEHLPDNAAEILCYAARHDYPALAAEAAPNLISMPLIEVASVLPPDILLPWIKYRHEWEKVLDAVAVPLRKGHRPLILGPLCPDCSHLRPVDLSVRSLRRLDTVFEEPFALSLCASFWEHWRGDVRRRIARIRGFAMAQG